MTRWHGLMVHSDRGFAVDSIEDDGVDLLFRTQAEAIEYAKQYAERCDYLVVSVWNPTVEAGLFDDPMIAYVDGKAQVFKGEAGFQRMRSGLIREGRWSGRMPVGRKTAAK